MWTACGVTPYSPASSRSSTPFLMRVTTSSMGGGRPGTVGSLPRVRERRTLLGPAVPQLAHAVAVPSQPTVHGRRRDCLPGRDLADCLSLQEPLRVPTRQVGPGV